MFGKWTYDEVTGFIVMIGVCLSAIFPTTVCVIRLIEVGLGL